MLQTIEKWSKESEFVFIDYSRPISQLFVILVQNFYDLLTLKATDLLQCFASYNFFRLALLYSLESLSYLNEDSLMQVKILRLKLDDNLWNNEECEIQGEPCKKHQD